MKAIIYTDNNQESERVSMLFKTLDIDYLEYKLGKDFTKKQFYSEFGENAQFPQVSTEYMHIGGLKETLHYLKENGVIN